MRGFPWVSGKNATSWFLKIVSLLKLLVIFCIFERKIGTCISLLSPWVYTVLSIAFTRCGLILLNMRRTTRHNSPGSIRPTDIAQHKSLDANNQTRSRIFSFLLLEKIVGFKRPDYNTVLTAIVGSIFWFCKGLLFSRCLRITLAAFVILSGNSGWKNMHVNYLPSSAKIGM